MGRLTRETIYALKGSVTTTNWFTALTVGAGGGFHPINVDRISLDANVDFDNSIGMLDGPEFGDVIQRIANPTITGYVHRKGASMLFLAHITGSDVVTGVTPKVHTMTQGIENNMWFTMAKEINNADIIEWESLKVVNYTLSPASNGFLQYSVNTIGSDINIAGDATNNGTAFDAVTYTTKALRIPFREGRFRINAQGGGALGSGDVVKINNFNLSFDRPHDREDLTQGVATGPELSTDFPIQGDDPNVTFSITVPDYTTIALLDDVKDETLYKADLLWTRTVGGVAYSFLIELGMLHPIPQDIGAEGRGRYLLTRNFRALRPSSTPTGMATSNIWHVVTNDDYATSYTTL